MFASASPIPIFVVIIFLALGGLELYAWYAGQPVTWRGGKVPVSDASKLVGAVFGFAGAISILFAHTIFGAICFAVMMLSGAVGMIAGYADHETRKTSQESKRRTEEKLPTEK